MSLDLRDEFREEYSLGYKDTGSSLGGVRQGLVELGRPEQSFKSVHITGSKGSSSTSAFTGRVLREARYTVGSFSGQTVTDMGVREKFQIDDEFISEAEFWGLAERVLSAVTTRDEWDVIVLMAIQYFAENDVDVAVFEAGVGGLSDSTNVLSAELSIITNAVVTPNHPELGDTDIEVAERKAGIIHSGSVAVANGTDEVHARLDELASRRNSAFYPKRDIVSFERDGAFFVGNYNGASVTTSVSASYLCENMNTALTGLVESVFEIGDDAILTAIREFVLPGRCEIIGKSPRFLIDGASNGFSASVVRDELNDIGDSSVLIFSGITDGDGWREVLEELDARDAFDEIIVPDCSRFGLVDPSVVAKEFDCEIVPTVSTAIGMARERAEDDEIVLCTGSLYLVRELRLSLLDGRE